MTSSDDDERKRPAPGDATRGKHADRAHRLAEALRENLRRRKAQARRRVDAGSDDDDAESR